MLGLSAEHHRIATRATLSFSGRAHNDEQSFMSALDQLEVFNGLDYSPRTPLVCLQLQADVADKRLMLTSKSSPWLAAKAVT